MYFTFDAHLNRIRMNFKNKVVLITGASSGIGAAAAIKFVQEGASVAMVGRNHEKLRNVSEKCTAAGVEPLVIVADVTKEDDVKRIFNDTIRHFGKLDVLVNNAGIISEDGILSENAMEVFDKILCTNLRSAVRLTHICTPQLIKTKGNIIIISSIASMRVTLENHFAYGTSKAALDKFTKCVAWELTSKGVRVNSINPGLVRTDLAQCLGVDKAMQDTFWDGFKNTTPLGKLAEAEEIADMILFVASDKAKSITGSSFVVDNGAMLIPCITLPDKP